MGWAIEVVVLGGRDLGSMTHPLNAWMAISVRI